jgi:transcriptional regulator with XRE-family HTH domain
MSVGVRVREARKAKALTQKVLAGKVGCSQQTIVDLEKGNVEWSRFMPAIADELNVSLHWVETGEGPRERPGKSQGAVPIVQWDFFAHAALTGDPPEVIDWAEGCPVDNSGSTVVVIVDDSTAFAMAGGGVVAGNWLFVDRKAYGDGLAIVVMPGWGRAELRELVTSGTESFLRVTNEALPDAVQQVALVTSLEDYRTIASDEFAELPPALMLGRVVFVGTPI